jgi:DNA-binding transcriptional regulator PaaX
VHLTHIHGYQGVLWRTAYREAAFRAFAAATLPLYEVSADDPDLPSELLPDDWPGDQLAAAIGRAFRVFVPLMVDYLGTLTSGTRLPGG